jgi:hypothetical protein
MGKVIYYQGQLAGCPLWIICSVPALRKCEHSSYSDEINTIVSPRKKITLVINTQTLISSSKHVLHRLHSVDLFQPLCSPCKN